MKVKPYFPKGVDALHEVRDWRKVRSLMRAARRGEKVPAYLVSDRSAEWPLLITGTHRAAANDLLELLGGERLIPVLDLGDLPDSDRACIEARMEHDDYAFRDIGH